MFHIIKNRFLRADVQIPTPLLIKEEYLVFLEDSMNHSHLVWIDITVIIKTAFCCLRIILFPDIDMSGDPVKKAEIRIQPNLTKGPLTFSHNTCSS